jgi:hypothetical protein
MSRSNLEPGKPGPGRPPGSRNKTSVAAKEAIALAAEGLGGTDRLIAWAQEDAKNEHTFWGTIYPKLIAVTVDASVNAKIEEVRHRIIDGPDH